MSSKKKLNNRASVNTFTKGLWKDALPSLTPKGTYNEAWNSVRQTEEESYYGLSNEPSNEIKVSLPGEVRGLYYVEERDKFVAFILNDSTGQGEIGVIDEKKCTYTRYCSSPDIELSQIEWVDVEAKVLQPCNQLYVYFSTKNTYKYFNLDDTCGDYCPKLLFDCQCVPAIKTKIIEGAGKLPNGVYQFAARLRDGDGNRTNWFKISNPVSISEGDHIAGERSRKAINVSLSNLTKDFQVAELAVISTIDGVSLVEQFDEIGFSEGDVDYLYRGKTGKEQTIGLSEILSRNTRYIRGKNLIQYDGRLILYNTLAQNNLDYQRKANEILVSYESKVVPVRYADQYKGLRPNESYWFGLRWNYCDGTSSTDFHIPGRAPRGNELDMVSGNCNNCEVPRWRAEDTSVRRFLYLEDVTLTNRGYESVVSYDGVPNRVPDTLTNDERDSIEYDPDDIPSEEDMTEEYEMAENDLNLQMDCLCEAAKSIAATVDPGSDGILGNIANLIDLLPGATGEDLVNILQAVESFLDGGFETLEDALSTIPFVGTTLGNAVDAVTDFLFGEDDNGCDVCEDITGHLALAQILCMCLTREVSGNGGGGDTPVEDPPRTPRPPGGFSPGGTPTTLDFLPTNIQGEITNALGALQSSSSQASNYTTTGSGRTPVRSVNYLLNQTKNYAIELRNSAQSRNFSYGAFEQPDLGEKCTQNKRRVCVDGTCYQCLNGRWQHLENSYQFTEKPSVTTNIPGGNALRTPVCGSKAPLGDNFNFKYVYDETGCEIIGVEPKTYAVGEFGYWETEETYPLTENCECEPIYGDLAGANVRLHKVPSVTKEPFFVSFQSGVPTAFNSVNNEDKDAYCFFISPKFDNIQVPDNLPKPLCPENPYSITYVKRTENNKSVIGSGVATSCFLGNIQGEDYVFPKHAVNSFEFYDRAIEPQGESTFRGGIRVEGASPYIIHSPDFHLWRPGLDATEVLFELELSGKGHRHALYAKGEDTGSAFVPRVNQKGAQQSVNLNHYQIPLGASVETGPLRHCVQAMSYAPADSVVAKNDEFTFPLSNLWRESSVYAEFDYPAAVPFVEGDKEHANKYGGLARQGDNASDRSFTGDTLSHAVPIHDVRAHYVTFTRWIPRQYGSPLTQVYEPLGLEATSANLESGSIGGLVGDSFVGFTSVKRTGYVSDKTPRIIAPHMATTGIEDNGKFWRKFIAGLLKSLFKVIGIRFGGYVPESFDDSDFINVFGGLRKIKDTINGPIISPGEIVEGDVPDPADPTTIPQGGDAFQDRNAGDNYYPHVVKTNMWGWYNADVNVHYRELGDENSGEVHYPTLKTLNVSSNFPEDSDWKEGYLTRFYSILEENARWKYIVQALFIFLFTYGIGLWIIIEGIKGIVEGSQAIGGGTYTLQTIGGVIAALVGIALVFIGITWIRRWAESDADNKLVATMLGIKNVYPDKKNSDGTYSIDDGKLRQFEDNYWAYNADHSRTNSFELGFGMGDPYNTCICPTAYNNKIYYSNKQPLQSSIDAWVNYQVNNFVDIPSDMGGIRNMFLLGDNIFAHTTDMIISLRSGGRSLELDEGSILLGSGNLFQQPAPLFGGVTEGYAGLLDPNATITTQWGYIFPDREARKLFIFDSKSPKPISDQGLQGFFQDNFHLILVDQFPEYEHVDNKSEFSVGYSIGVDHEHSRLLFTKTDYEAYAPYELTYVGGAFFKAPGGKTVTVKDTDYFCVKTFTTSYDPINESWISFHSYAPKLYAWNRFNMYTFNREGMWVHNKKGSFLNFYGASEPWVVEFTTFDEETRDAFTLDSVLIDGEAYEYKDGRYLRNPQITFDTIMVYNSYQNTGENLIIDQDNLSVLDRSKETTSHVRSEFKMRKWSFNEFFDRLKDFNEHQFENPCVIALPPVDETNIKSDFDKETTATLHDTFFRVRLVFQDKEQIKMFLKESRGVYKTEL